ncbi:MAG: alcohol dehydrogenase catalytic domain-containing protein [Alphaproteobacteria bacterium]|nr:alcohol dehydrogenase catalytic domain-containing protein [Alphaproteobacteria bacterium]
MRAAILKAFGEPLVVEEKPDLKPAAMGEVVVDVVVTRILGYMGEVLSGARNYMLETPAIPGAGAIGRVRAVGPDATLLKPGDWVYCDPTVRSRDNAEDPDITLQGLSARGEGGLKLQRYFHDGSWAEQMRLPTENAIPIGPIRTEDAGGWCAMGSYLVPYGGFLKGDLKAGETVLVSGATGGFGRSAVAVALAMGAGCVIATGRNKAALDSIVRRHGERVRVVAMEGDEDADRAAIIKAAPGPIDCVFDMLPPMASAIQARTAIMAVRRYGRVILMGGINMQGGPGLELSYAWLMRNCITIHGVWMYPPHAPAALAKMIRAGQLAITAPATRFSLDQVNDAVAHAASSSGRTELWPGGAP